LYADPAGAITYHPTPIRVPLPNDELGCDVAAGESFTVVSTCCGKVYTFGDIGDERWQPTPQKAFSDIKSVNVAAGDRHVLILTETGNVYALGSGSNSELGLGNDTSDKKAPVKIEPLTEIIHIRAYKSSSFAINSMQYLWVIMYTI
jgi:hypothetical protein